MLSPQLEHYKILKEIRRSNTAQIFHALTPGKQEVVLKVLLESAARRDVRKSLKRETALLKKLRHPNIIKVYEFFDAYPRPFMVMEYFPGENLKYLMWHREEWLLRCRYRALKQAADAIHFCHRQGVIHLDVKPENILVDEKANVRLIDFSIAQTKGFQLFRRRKVSGTPLYMSPEQIKGEKLDQRSDIYSFGATIYEVLTRRPPFIGVNQDSILKKHLSETPSPMKDYDKNIPLPLDNVVSRMLSKDRAQRFDNLASVIMQLTRLAEEEERKFRQM
jgi:serine/threonine-protein kinase